RAGGQKRHAAQRVPRPALQPRLSQGGRAPRRQRHESSEARMSFLLRFFKVWILSFFGPKYSDLKHESNLSLRVWPNDLDLNIHVNNGRYLTLMDLGRMDL